MTDDKFSFKPGKKDVHDDIDTELKSLQKRDKIQLVTDVKEKPPKPGEMKVEIKDGEVYAIDLNALLLAQLSDCPATVIPMLIDHGVRTAVDIKKAYNPEKRHLDFQYWWLIFLIIGLGGAVLFADMMFGLF